MANKKITELNEATSISNNDWLVMVDVANDETKKIHAGEVGGNIPIQDTAPQNPEENDLWIDTSDNNRLKYFNGTNWIGVSDNIAGDTLPIGTISPFGSSTPPTNWLVCDGSAVSRTTYADLFAAIGTSFGSGDGSTTFNLPNLKGRVAVGIDSNDTLFDTIGETGGSKNAVVVQHDHAGLRWIGNDNYPISLNQGSASSGYQLHYNATANPFSQGTINTAFAGESGTNKNLQPYQVVCYIIKANQSAGVVAEVENASSNSQTNVYSCDYINDCNSYSTTETFTGKHWTDGKPVYRKVVPFTTTWSSNEQTVALVSGYSTIIKVDVFSEDGRNLAWYDKSQIDCYMSNGSLKFKPDNADFNNKSWNAIVEYTKSN